MLPINIQYGASCALHNMYAKLIDMCQTDTFYFVEWWSMWFLNYQQP